MITKLVSVMLMFCVPVLVFGQGSAGQPAWQCMVDEEVRCWEIFQALNPSDPNYLSNPGLGNWDPDPQPLGYCTANSCIGPMELRRCNSGGIFRPLFPPGADWWFMARVANVGESGSISIEEVESTVACAELTLCRCVGLAQFCSTGDIIEWFPVETETDPAGPSCEGTAWGDD